VLPSAGATTAATDDVFEDADGGAVSLPASLAGPAAAAGAAKPERVLTGIKQKKKKAESMTSPRRKKADDGMDDPFSAGYLDAAAAASKKAPASAAAPEAQPLTRDLSDDEE